MIGLFVSIATEEDSAELVILQSFGEISGFCTKLNLYGPVDSIRASYSPNTGSVSAISYRRNDAQRTFGALLSNYVEWTFNSTSRFMGFHGRVHEKEITQLGVITEYTNATPTECVSLKL